MNINDWDEFVHVKLIENLLEKAKRNNVFIDPSIADMYFMVFVRIEQAKQNRKEKAVWKIENLRKKAKNKTKRKKA